MILLPCYLFIYLFIRRGRGTIFYPLLFRLKPRSLSLLSCCFLRLSGSVGITKSPRGTARSSPPLPNVVLFWPYSWHRRTSSHARGHHTISSWWSRRRPLAWPHVCMGCSTSASMGGLGEPLRHWSVWRHRRSHHTAHAIVHWISTAHLLLGCCKLHSLLLLSLITEPHPHYILLQVQLLCYCGYLLSRWSGLYSEICF